MNVNLFCFRPSRSSSMASKQDTDSDTQDVSIISHISNSKPLEKKVMVNSASQSLSSPPGQDSLDNGDPAGDASSPPLPRQILNRSTTRSSSSSFSESLDPALDPSCLPPPDPWLDSGNGNNGSVSQSGGGGTGTLCRRDGHWFLKLLQAETGRMEGWCQQMEQEVKDNQLSEEGRDDITLTGAAAFSVHVPQNQPGNAALWENCFNPDIWPLNAIVPSD